CETGYELDQVRLSVGSGLREYPSEVGLNCVVRDPDNLRDLLHASDFHHSEYDPQLGVRQLVMPAQALDSRAVDSGPAGVDGRYDGEAVRVRLSAVERELQDMGYMALGVRGSQGNGASSPAFGAAACCARKWIQ